MDLSNNKNSTLTTVGLSPNYCRHLDSICRNQDYAILKIISVGQIDWIVSPGEAQDDIREFVLDLLSRVESNQPFTIHFVPVFQKSNAIEI